MKTFEILDPTGSSTLIIAASMTRDRDICEFRDADGAISALTLLAPDTSVRTLAL